MEPMEYYVMQNNGGAVLWLAEDEKTWTLHFGHGAAFADARLANDIAVRELGADGMFYVMGCMPTMCDDETT